MSSSLLALLISWSSFQSFSLLHLKILLAASAILFFLGGVFVIAFNKPKAWQETSDSISSFARFFYVSFLKPHTGDGLAGQQGALESFYNAQVWWPFRFFVFANS